MCRQWKEIRENINKPISTFFKNKIKARTRRFVSVRRDFFMNRQNAGKWYWRRKKKMSRDLFYDNNKKQKQWQTFSPLSFKFLKSRNKNQYFWRCLEESDVETMPCFSCSHFLCCVSLSLFRSASTYFFFSHLFFIAVFIFPISSSASFVSVYFFSSGLQPSLILTCQQK